jgi:hypothetical protein
MQDRAIAHTELWNDLQYWILASHSGGRSLCTTVVLLGHNFNNSVDILKVLLNIPHWRAKRRNFFVHISDRAPIFLRLVHAFFGFSFCLTLVQLHETSPLFCKLMFWKALRFKDVFYETSFDTSPKTYALKKSIVYIYIYIYKYSFFNAIFRVISQHTCIDASAVRRTTAHYPEPPRDLWLVSREEAASLPTSDSKDVGLIINWSPCIKLYHIT